MKLKDILFYLLIVVIIGLTIYIYFYIKSESYNCMNRPLQYGLSKFNSNITCNCYMLGSTQIMLVTKDNITISDINTGISNLLK